MTDQKKVVEILLAMAKVLEENKEFLTDLDNEIGDVDHGNLTIGEMTRRQHVENILVVENQGDFWNH